ncbi:MAG: EamA family transporter, partial [Nevskiales bacterium]
MAGERLRHTGLFPNLSLAAVALAAGFNWMPLRFLASRGLTSAWAGLLTAMVAALVLLPVALAQRGRLNGAVLRSLVVTGLINGASMALYIAALLLTDVVRALVLFYLAPMWGVIMGIAVLHEKLTVARTAAVA